MDSLGLFRHKDFGQFIHQVSNAPKASLTIKKLAAFETLLANDNILAVIPDLKNKFSEADLRDVFANIKNWKHSSDFRKRRFVAKLDQILGAAIKEGNTQKIESLIESGFFDINSQNISGYSILLLADYYGRIDLVHWILSKPEFDLSIVDAKGFNQIEQLKRINRNDLAAEIQRLYPEIKSRDFKLQERNTDGTPIIDFVTIEPKSFLMGKNNGEKTIVTLTQRFHIQSTQTTQNQWKEVVNMLTKQFPDKYKNLNADPAHFKGLNSPVESISFVEIETWINGLNQLSHEASTEIQTRLSAIFPGHQKGDQYGLPTEAEREFVQRNQGLAEGNFSFGNDGQKLQESAWFQPMITGFHTHPVGMKSPLFVNGRPIYDIQGNVSEVASDWHSEELKGGIDPQGPSMGKYRVTRGGSFFTMAQDMKSEERNFLDPLIRSDKNGFRLIRRVSSEEGKRN